MNETEAQQQNQSAEMPQIMPQSDSVPIKKHVVASELVPAGSQISQSDWRPVLPLRPAKY
jgi:hypothetical protein